MLTKFKNFASKSKVIIIVCSIYDNWRSKRRFKAGRIVTSSGSTHKKMSLSESINYVNEVFDDYLTYSNITTNMLRNKRILEIGPGDNFGVALKFLIAGAAQVVCLDKFFSKRDLVQQSKIYKELRENANDDEREIFDNVVDPNGTIRNESQRLRYTHGIGIEEAGKIFESESFDFIVSRAVVEHLYDTDAAFSMMNKLLIPGGYLIHKIDLRDHGMFSSRNFHPLTFLTIPNLFYRLMTYDSSKPNRKQINYYRQKMIELKYDTKILITHIVGSEVDVIPHKTSIKVGVDYSESIISLINKIRPHLQAEFKDMPIEELMVSGIFLVGRKPMK